MNSVCLTGRLTRDPELRYSQSNMAICSFAVAVDAAGGRDEAGFFDVVCFDKQAGNCGQYLHKGSLVGVQGSLAQEKWQDKQTGAARSAVKVKAFRVDFLEPRPRAEGEPQGETAEDDFFGA